jgi:hypothetical protein
MTGMENIGASYKYPRKSPCEAKADFFVFASRVSQFFNGNENFLLILPNSFTEEYNFVFQVKLNCLPQEVTPQIEFVEKSGQC